ncbi:MAG: hypothetical protein C0600_07095 [Ignavibacteria bacterium]|nr:MAG: hypothetical protein C0600_07095 [Ignavibacteria bacterium]
MARKMITLLAILALVNLTTGCKVYDTKMMSLQELTQQTEQNIAEVVLASGSELTFNDAGGIYDTQRQVVSGLDVMGKRIEVDADKVLYVRVKHVNSGASTVTTFAAIIGLLGVAALIIAAQSCPLVYSFDGEQFVFDAEPLGGAICRGLARTDFSRLEHLVGTDGRYRLLVRNELAETQHLDCMRLRVVDHPKGTKVYPDFDGTLYAVSDPVAPSMALDERGKDISPFIFSSDGIAWQSVLPHDSSQTDLPLRHELTFSFPVPEGSTTASLLINAGTATWGSNMIRAMLELRGSAVDDWYADVDAGGFERLKLGMFMLREELYVLKVFVQTGTSWTQRAIIGGSGPYMTEDRLYALDLTGIEGDSLHIRVRPPRGFWSLDHVAISYTPTVKPEQQTIEPVQARTQDGHNIRTALARMDQQYHDMPMTGDAFHLEFEAPAMKEDLERSLFLETTGYYMLHLEKQAPPQTDIIQELMNTPDMIVSHSLNQYLQWRDSHVSATK